MPPEPAAPALPGPPDDATLRRYVAAVRGLLDHGGYERSGKTEDTRRWRTGHIGAWLEAHGRPDRRRTVHVAGSKGKGSTAAMVEAILRAAGAHTLLLVSPDVHSARERATVDGRPLDHATFAALAERLLADPDCAGWSYFELVTVLGWLAGEQTGCDWQVVEVGLGGRLDTTNAMAGKDVAVITPIDLEHTAILGDTIPQIAAEKAGIITGPSAVVTAPMRESAVRVVRERAQAAGATLHEVPAECAMRIAAHDRQGLRLDLRTPLRAYRGLRLPTPGQHQAENAATAVRAAELALAAEGRELPVEAVFEGLAGLRLPCRFEVIDRRPLHVIDALHTPLAARRFAETVRAVQPPRPHVYVLGMLEGKDAAAVAGPLLPPEATVVVTAPGSARAADPLAVARACEAHGAAVQRAPDVASALALAADLAGQRGSVFVVGSLYTASEAREQLLGVTGDRLLGLR